VPLLDMALADTTPAPPADATKTAATNDALLSIDLSLAPASKQVAGERRNFMFADEEDRDGEKWMEEDEQEDDFLRGNFYKKQTDSGIETAKPPQQATDALDFDLLSLHQPQSKPDPPATTDYQQFDLLGTDLHPDASEGVRQSDSRASKPLSELESILGESTGKTASKLKRRGDKSANESDQRPAQTPQPTAASEGQQWTPAKSEVQRSLESQFDSESRQGSQAKRLSGTSGKRPQGTPIRKDSFSDEENKYVIG